MLEIQPKGTGSFALQGRLTFLEATLFFKQAQSLISQAADTSLTLDLSGLERIDSAGVAALDELITLGRSKEKKVELIGASEQIAETISSFSVRKETKAAEARKPGFLEGLGQKTYAFYDAARKLLYLTADTFYWGVTDLFNRKSRLEGSVVNQCVLVGVNALPIVAILSFLVGFVLALQSAAQLRQFGANIYIADLITISMMREMGPLMTAIIIAGRSGSSFASEIATMKVTEELDAMKAMALNPVRFVVIPKFYAMTICMPLLTIMADVIGILGGVAIAITYLELSPTAFLNEALTVMVMKDVVTSIVKSFVFAWIICMVGCFFGFQAFGGPEGVGKVTTKSVVVSIFIVIVADSILGLLFYFGAPIV